MLMASGWRASWRGKCQRVYRRVAPKAQLSNYGGDARNYGDVIRDVAYCRTVPTDWLRQYLFEAIADVQGAPPRMALDL